MTRPERSRLRVVAAVAPDESFSESVSEVAPDAEVVVDTSLLGDEPLALVSRAEDEQARYERLVASADVLFGIPDQSPALLAATIARGGRLEWLHTMAAGGGAQIKRAGLDRRTLDRIAFTSSAGLQAGPLAEFAVFGILAGAKCLPTLSAQSVARSWTPVRMKHLKEMRVLVLGAGGIGSRTGQLLKSFGATVIGIKRSPQPSADFDAVHGLDMLDRLVAEVDALVVALPGTESTTHLVDSRLISLMKRGILIVNVGRGAVIDESALIDALEREHIGFACLDVTESEPLSAESPLWSLPNALISPHSASHDELEAGRVTELFVENLSRFIHNEPLMNRIDTEHFY